MSLTQTTSLPLGFQAPSFNLPNTVTGKQETLEDWKGEKGTVVMFICNHCPYVVHLREKIVEVARKYQALGISFIAISSNDVENYPQDAPQYMKELAESMDFPFPYLYDESQQVAKDYDAACTPDFSVFDASLTCVYRGRFDGSTPGNGVEVTGDDLAECLDHMLAGEPVQAHQIPSMGCNIKWK